MALTYDEALEFLFPRTTTIKFGLATTRALLRSLGNPHEVVPRPALRETLSRLLRHMVGRKVAVGE